MVVFREGKNFSPHLCLLVGTGAPIQLVTVVSSPKINIMRHGSNQYFPFSTAVVRIL